MLKEELREQVVQDVLKSNESVKFNTGIASLPCFMLFVNRPFRDFPNLMTSNRMRMALTIYNTAFNPAYFTRSCEKGLGNGRILANGKSISRIPFRTEKEDYLWRLYPISEKIFRKIAFPFDLKPKFPEFFG